MTLFNNKLTAYVLAEDNALKDYQNGVYSAICVFNFSKKKPYFYRVLRRTTM